MQTAEMSLKRCVPLKRGPDLLSIDTPSHGIDSLQYSITEQPPHGGLLQGRIRCVNDSHELLSISRCSQKADAADFSGLILKSPYEDSLALKVNLSDRWLLALSRYKWDHARRGGAGSFVLCLQRQSSSSTQPSRLEPLFVPDKIDFVLPLGGDRRYTRIDSRHFWVPYYRSDQEKEYEKKQEKAVCLSVELVPLPDTYPLCFGEDSDDSAGITRESQRNETVTHLETTHFCNTNLQRFFTALTGWKLVVVFSATDVQPDKHRLPFNKRSRPADVMCFRTGLETRVAIRMKDPDDETTIDWISATLVEQVEVKTMVQKLYLMLKSRKKGRRLTLASVTAADGKMETVWNKTETWVVTVASGSGEIFAIINVRARL